MTTSSRELPPTVNMHVVGHCNYSCHYCYARFNDAKQFLPLRDALEIVTQLRAQGARKITFAGGEPTLHPHLAAMLDHCSQLGLVTSLVTNASRLDRDMCRRLFPRLRWLVMSCDSPSRATNDALGRRNRRLTDGQPIRVEQVAAWLHEWNRSRVEDARVRLKLNMVITSLNVQEDPSEWLRALRPERVKLLQCCVIPGENADADHLRCEPQDFRRYVERARGGTERAITIVGETSEDLLDSYAMIDPRGRFRQAHATGYVESAPIVEVGVRSAWDQVGGCDRERFRARGGEYDGGAPVPPPRPQVIAIEGLDGSGKSTIVRALAEHLEATVVHNPPAHLRAERTEADKRGPAERRAWYWSANRVAMAEATDAVFAGRRVVMDRCFASTAAYGAAELGAIASTADVPADAPRPDIVLLLHVDEAVRRQRLQDRGDARTTEERRLETDGAFRERVIAGYRALGAVLIDATGSMETVLQKAMHIVDNVQEVSR